MSGRERRWGITDRSVRSVCGHAAEAPTKDAKWITNVTRPTISVFRPDAANRAGVAIVICPGGGYWNLAWDKEGEEVAAWLNTLGITGVVLKYRVPRRPGEPERLPAPGPLLDAQRAISLVRSRAERVGHRPGADRDHGVLGRRTSGGDDGDLVREAARTSRSMRWIAQAAGRTSRWSPIRATSWRGRDRPCSPIIIRIPKGTGPMFLVHASDDDEPGAQPEQSLALYRALRDAGVPAELHIYDEGGHGFGVRKTGRPVSSWPERCAEWMRHRGILPCRSPWEQTCPSRPAAAQGHRRNHHDALVQRLPRTRAGGSSRCAG